jgi:hypothetical protein
VRRVRRPLPIGVAPLPPQTKWRAITISTLLLLPAYWGVVSGLVAAASDRADAPPAGPPIAFGLALLPFVFIALAFLSQHPRAPSAVMKAMGLTLLIGIPAAAIAPDAVSGIVAGIGAGGAAALRPEHDGVWKARALGVLAVSVFAATFVYVVPDVVLLLAPTLPFTCLGVADHALEMRRGRSEHAGPGHPR